MVREPCSDPDVARHRTVLKYLHCPVRPAPGACLARRSDLGVAGYQSHTAVCPQSRTPPDRVRSASFVQSVAQGL